MLSLNSLQAKASRLLRTATELATRPQQATNPLSRYAGKPVEYVREVLRIEPTPDQIAILNAIHKPPCRVLVPSATATGKTFIAGALTNYWWDVFNPGVVLTTAPTERDVVDLLWAEVRMQRRNADLPEHFIGPKAPTMYTAENHYAKGFTASKGQTFKGRHFPRMLFIFDEGTQVARQYYGLTRTMFDPSLGHSWLVIFNPDNADSAPHDIDLGIADGREEWHKFPLSALTHPNIISQLNCGPKVIPHAVSLERVNDALKESCDPIHERDATATDLLWPPLWATEYCQRHGIEPRWYRPGMEFQAYVQGLWPRQGDGVWSNDLFEACCVQGAYTFPLTVLPEVGCDTAQGKAADWHAIHARWAARSVSHETSNTMDPEAIKGRLRVVCGDMAARVNTARGRNTQAITGKQILIRIDDDGTGGAIAAGLRAEGYRVLQIGAGTKANNPEKYPNKRSELWFQTRDRAKKGLVCFADLMPDVRRRLRQQLLAPTWELQGGQRVVEPKEVTKEKIGRSPDDADAVNLAYADYGAFETASTVMPNAGGGGTPQMRAREAARQEDV